MQTLRKERIARVILTAAVLFFVSVPAAMGQEINLKDRWAVGLRVGPSVLTQNLGASILSTQTSASDVQGDAGPVISGDIMYALEEMLLLGINIEWETHSITANGGEFGTSSTISIIPTLEFRATEMMPLSPYLSFGMGFNLNSFDFTGNPRSTLGTHFNPETTAALKAGIGADYFLTKNTALNGEVGYKYNSGNLKVCSPYIGGCNPTDWRLSTVSILIGLRYFF
jgi:opacity protein-like surface antigen